MIGQEGGSLVIYDFGFTIDDAMCRTLTGEFIHPLVQEIRFNVLICQCLSTHFVYQAGIRKSARCLALCDGS